MIRYRHSTLMIRSLKIINWSFRLYLEKIKSLLFINITKYIFHNMHLMKEKDLLLRVLLMHTQILSDGFKIVYMFYRIWLLTKYLLVHNRLLLIQWREGLWEISIFNLKLIVGIKNFWFEEVQHDPFWDGTILNNQFLIEHRGSFGKEHQWLLEFDRHFQIIIFEVHNKVVSYIGRGVFSYREISICMKGWQVTGCIGAFICFWQFFYEIEQVWILILIPLDPLG